MSVIVTNKMITEMASIYSSIIYPLLMEDFLPLESGSYGLDNLPTEEPMTATFSSGTLEHLPRD